MPPSLPQSLGYSFRHVMYPLAPPVDLHQLPCQRHLAAQHERRHTARPSCPCRPAHPSNILTGVAREVKQDDMADLHLVEVHSPRRLVCRHQHHWDKEVFPCEGVEYLAAPLIVDARVVGQHLEPLAAPVQPPQGVFHPPAVLDGVAEDECPRHHHLVQLPRQRFPLPLKGRELILGLILRPRAVDEHLLHPGGNAVQARAHDAPEVRELLLDLGKHRCGYGRRDEDELGGGGGGLADGLQQEGVVEEEDIHLVEHQGAELVEVELAHLQHAPEPAWRGHEYVYARPLHHAHLIARIVTTSDTRRSDGCDRCQLFEHAGHL
mmetsp:Transcript_25496/g.73626  ORF Transcript_25496/g.73626 Transcript_25496/m.73626 type:complete len:321 (-) Transcript_25496:749-1711(-)